MTIGANSYPRIGVPSRVNRHYRVWASMGTPLHRMDICRYEHYLYGDSLGIYRLATGSSLRSRCLHGIGGHIGCEKDTQGFLLVRHKDLRGIVLYYYS